MKQGSALHQIGPHYYFDTANRTFCLARVHMLIAYGYGTSCLACETVLSAYRRQQLLPEGDRCQGTTRSGYRCQRDGVYNGYCPSHLDQDPERTHLHPPKLEAVAA